MRRGEVAEHRQVRPTQEPQARQAGCRRPYPRQDDRGAHGALEERLRENRILLVPFGNPVVVDVAVFIDCPERHGEQPSAAT
jgi:hypothetical protein